MTGFFDTQEDDYFGRFPKFVEKTKDGNATE